MSLGDAFAHQFKYSEAFQWYRKAAIQGNVDGEFHVGDGLLFRAAEPHGNLSTRIEGLHWTFMAATNLYPYAYLDMSKALEQGVGTSIDLVQSYAWLKLFSETSPGGIYGRVLMNSMALKMGTEEIERAQRLAADFRAGHWQFPNTRVIPDNDSALKLTAITISSAASLAVINGKTLLPGESTIISLKSGKVGLRCLKIDKDFVQVLISGEDEPRVLRLGN